MAINKKLIHFKSKQKFEEELAKGNILDTSIVFIQDSKEIWTHGLLYSCSLKTDGTGNLYLSDDGTYKEIVTEFTETDPVFSASAASSIKPSDISNWNSKTSNIGTITGITMNGTNKGTSGVVNLGTVLTEHQDISGKADKSSLATVATSGSYNDLSNTPTITSILGMSYYSTGITLSYKEGSASKSASVKIPKLDRLESYTTATTVANLDANYSNIYVTLSSNASLSVSNYGSSCNGRSITAYVYSTSSRTITIPTTGNYISMCGSSYTTTANRWVEFNLTCINGIWHIAKLEQL